MGIYLLRVTIASSEEVSYKCYGGATRPDWCSSLGGYYLNILDNLTYAAEELVIIELLLNSEIRWIKITINQNTGC